MTIDTKKRSTMKVLAAVSGAMAAPSFVAANFNQNVDTDFAASAPIRGTGLVVSFTDAPAVGNTRKVIITNTSDTAVKLSHVYPGVVSTPQGSYDLNSLLIDGSREFGPRQATTLNIDVVKLNEAQYPIPNDASPNTWVSVRTRDNRINGGKQVTTVRHMYS